MSKARLVITAVVVEGRKPSEVAEAYGVSRSWLYELLARHRLEGDAAFETRSRRPKTTPNATPASTVELIRRLRQHLTAAGLDAGPETIIWHLEQHHGLTVSRAPVARRPSPGQGRPRHSRAEEETTISSAPIRGKDAE